MAESYRGLTISIGGDTTKLTKALHTANQAISGTQSELRRLGQAVKLDPTSIDAMKLQMGAMAAQATNTAARMQTLNKAIKEIGDHEFDGQSIRELAENTRSAQLDAAVAVNTYNALTKSLAEVHTEVTKLGKEALQAKLPDITSALDFDKLVNGETTVKEMAKTLRELPQFIRPSASAVKEFSAGVTEIQKRFEGAKTEAQKLAAMKDFNGLRDALVKAMAPIYNNENGNTAASRLKRDLESMAGVIDIPAEKIAELVRRATNLNPAFEAAKEEAIKFKEVAQFQDLVTETTKVSASLNNMNAALSSLDVPSEAAKKVEDINIHAKSLGDSLGKSMQELSSLDAALKLNPENMDLLARRATVLADANKMATEWADQLRQKIANYDVDGIEKVRDATMSVKEQAIQASKAYQEQSAEVSRLTAEISHLKERRGELSADKGKDSYRPQEVANLTKQINQLNGELESAKKKEEELSAVAELLKQALNMDEDNASLSKVLSIIDQLAEKGGELAKTDITPKFDKSVVKALDEIYEKSSIALKSTWGDASALGNAYKDATARVNELNTALKNDPDKDNLKAARAKAISDAISIARVQQQALNRTMKDMPESVIARVAEGYAVVSQRLATNKERYAQNRNEIKRLEEVQKELTKQYDELSKKTIRTDDDKAKLEKLRGEIKNVVSQLKELSGQISATDIGEIADDEAALKVLNAKDKVKELEAEVNNLRHTAGETKKKDATPKIDSAAFMQATQMISQAARRMASEVVQSANEIDAAYRDMRKTVQGSEADLQALKESAVEYSQTHITSADTMLEMQALGGQLGILIDDLEEFGVITSNLDISTNMDAEDIALRLGQVANVLDLDIEGMQGFSDALVRLGNNMPTQESNIMNIAQRFAAVANTANFSGSEILAWSAAIASTGQRSEMAATAIGNTVSAIEQSLANGGEGFNAFATVAQMSAKDFAEAWKKDPTEALKAFIEGLRTLKDSDESAVATLENMGITGVRQQQTLLGLSNTVDKLGDALKMSEDAWNGVDDEWGQAGDAAIEAQKKSEGFSGALAILQNNAKDLAESFGDSLVVPMQAAADILKMITDTMNSMPAPLKTIITLVGGAALAFGTIAPVVKVFSTGLGALVTTAGTSGGNLAAFATQVLGIGTAAKGAATGVGMLNTALGGLAIGALVVAVMGAVSAISQLADQTETMRMATDGLTSSMDAVKQGYEDYAANTKKAVTSTDELVKRTKEVIENQATLAKSMSETWRSYGSEAALVDDLAQRIVNLTKKGDLNAKQQGELVAAVKAYNDATDASIRVIDAHTGKLSMSNEALLNNAAAWKEAAENEIKYDMFKDLVRQRIEAQQAYEDAVKKEKELREYRDSLTEDNFNSQKYATVTDEIRQVELELDKAREVVAELEPTYNSAEEAENKFLETMDYGTGIVAKMRKQLVDAGQSTKEFDSLTEDELDELAKRWANGATDIIAEIKKIKDATKDAADISSNMTEQSKAAIKKAAKEAKTLFDQQYKMRKRELDAEVEEQQRANERANKEQQRANDRAYKAKQKELDAEYKAAQKAYDKEYKAAQKAFDSEYKAAQKAFDSEYKAFQKQLDQHYKARQKALDAEYNSVKDALDDEYDERKKQYDNQLKALKKAQDAEVDAFNKATDAKLKAMEREYKEKLRLLELEYGQYDSGLEEQIKALDAETEAEKKAIETRNENDKIAELQREVERANSRRKRAEAEKALNDYLQEIDQKHNEEQRKVEQERLKDELQSRKDALKEQYDADVAAYKEKRATELDALKEANDVEYEARKEYFDLQLEQLKEAQSAQLEALKEQHTLQLEAMKEAQSAQLESLKEAQSFQLEALKEAQSEQLEALKESQTAELETMKEHQQEALDSLKQEQQDELDAQKQKQQDELDSQKESNQKKLDDLKAAQSKELEEIKSGNKQKSDEQKSHEKNSEDTGKKTGEKYASGIATGYQKAMGATMESSERMLKEWKRSERDAAEAADRTGENYEKNIRKYQDPIKATVATAMDEVKYQMDRSGDSKIWGSDMMTNFINGFVDNWNGFGWRTVFGIAQQLANIWGHSVPKEGPLHDDDKWGGHLVDNLINGMRSKEGELYRQAEKMARTIEEGFDPTLTVDAAYEAIEAINKGRSASMAQLVAEGKGGDIKIEVNISDVSVRSDADIDRLASEVSRRMADELRRQQAGRL